MAVTAPPEGSTRLTINIAADLLRRFKLKTVSEGTTMSQVLIEAIEQYVGSAERPPHKSAQKRRKNE